MPTQPNEQQTDKHLFTCEVCKVSNNEDTHPTTKMVWTITHTLIGDLMLRAEDIMRAEGTIERASALGELMGFDLIPPESKEMYKKSIVQFQMIIWAIEQLVVDTSQALHPKDRDELDKLKMWTEGN